MKAPLSSGAGRLSARPSADVKFCRNTGAGEGAGGGTGRAAASHLRENLPPVPVPGSPGGTGLRAAAGTAARQLAAAESLFRQPKVF